ncbi:hypothetical protein MTO96_033554 [Rhipicephalus appendiculatus]
MAGMLTNEPWLSSGIRTGQLLRTQAEVCRGRSAVGEAPGTVEDVATEGAATTAQNCTRNRQRLSIALVLLRPSPPDPAFPTMRAFPTRPTNHEGLPHQTRRSQP